MKIDDFNFSCHSLKYAILLFQPKQFETPQLSFYATPKPIMQQILSIR